MLLWFLWSRLFFQTRKVCKVCKKEHVERQTASPAPPQSHHRHRSLQHGLRDGRQRPGDEIPDGIHGARGRQGEGANEVPGGGLEVGHNLHPVGGGDVEQPLRGTSGGTPRLAHNGPEFG